MPSDALGGMETEKDIENVDCINYVPDSVRTQKSMYKSQCSLRLSVVHGLKKKKEKRKLFF